MRTHYVLTALALAACSGGDIAGPPPAPLPARMEAVTLTSFSGIVGTAVEPRPTVRVLDAVGQPVRRVPIIFSSSAGTFSGDSTVLTDSAGNASISWVLAGQAGIQQLTARLPVIHPQHARPPASIVFTALAQPGPIASLVALEIAHVGSGPPPVRRVRVKAADKFDNPLGGLEVRFTVAHGGGSVSSPTAVTDSNGTATSGDWTFGPSGMQQLNAQSGAVDITVSAQLCVDECAALLYVRDGHIHEYDFQTGASRQLTADGRIAHPAWSPDGRRIAFARFGSGATPPVEVFIMDAGDPTVVRQRTVGGPYHSPSWSPDGRSLAMAGDWWACIYECAIYIAEADSDAPPRRLAAMGAEPAWSPDGSRIAYVSLSGDDGYHALHAISPDSTQSWEIVPRESHAIYSPSWSPDGKRLAFSLCDNGCDVYTVMADGSAMQRLTHLRDAYGTAWSLDGQHIAFESSRGIGLVSASGGTPVFLGVHGSGIAWRP